MANLIRQMSSFMQHAEDIFSKREESHSIQVTESWIAHKGTRSNIPRGDPFLSGVLHFFPGRGGVLPPFNMKSFIAYSTYRFGSAPSIRPVNQSIYKTI